MIDITADLHMHTNASDGRLTADELFLKAKKKGLDVIAITDHDTLGDVKGNILRQKTYTMNYIPGIELSTLYKSESVHILGYFDVNQVPVKPFQTYSKELMKKRIARMKTFLNNLKTHYAIDLDYKGVEKKAYGMIARPHLAAAIVEKYPTWTADALFKGPLSEQSKAYVPSAKLTTSEGIALIKKHGGTVVLAHPVLMRDTIHNEVLELHFDGIETYYPLHDALFRTVYKAHAKDKGWLVTAGSDYHGIPGDTKHGDLGSERLKGEELVSFLRNVKS